MQQLNPSEISEIIKHELKSLMFLLKSEMKEPSSVYLTVLFEFMVWRMFRTVK
jgi:hypothetical protein